MFSDGRNEFTQWFKTTFKCREFSSASLQGDLAKFVLKVRAREGPGGNAFDKIDEGGFSPDSSFSEDEVRSPENAPNGRFSATIRDKRPSRGRCYAPQIHYRPASTNAVSRSRRCCIRCCWDIWKRSWQTSRLKSSTYPGMSKKSYGIL